MDDFDLIEIDYEEKINEYMKLAPELNSEANEFVNTMCRLIPAYSEHKEELYRNMKLLLIQEKYNCLLFIK